MIKQSLKNKLTFSILGVIFIFGSLAVSFVYLYSEKVFLEKEETLLKTVIIEESYNINNVFNYSRSISKIISSQDILITYLKDNNRKLQDLNILNYFQKYNIDSFYSSIYVLDKDGITQTSIDESFTGKDYSFRDYFKQAIDNNPYIDVSVGVTSNKLGYYFSYPIKDVDSSNIIGVLVLKLKPDVIESCINLFGFNINHSNILLTDEYGVVVFSNNKDFIYKSVVNLSEKELKEIRDKQRFPSIDIVSIDNYGLNKSDLYLDNNQEKIIDLKEENKIIIISKIESTPFFIVINKDRDFVFEKIADTSRVLALFIFFTALLASLIINFIVGKFLFPLISFNKVVKDISIDDLAQEIKVDCDDEICELADNFNKMIQKLKNELELSKKSEKERTKQLEELNRES